MPGVQGRRGGMSDNAMKWIGRFVIAAMMGVACAASLMGAAVFAAVLYLARRDGVYSERKAWQDDCTSMGRPGLRKEMRRHKRG